MDASVGAPRTPLPGDVLRNSYSKVGRIAPYIEIFCVISTITWLNFHLQLTTPITPQNGQPYNFTLAFPEI